MKTILLLAAGLYINLPPPQNLTFSVAFTGTQPMTYQWYWNGKIWNGATKPSLTVFSVSERSNGAYVCVARNAYGVAQSEPYLLAIKNQ